LPKKELPKSEFISILYNTEIPKTKMSYLIIKREKKTIHVILFINSNNDYNMDPMSRISKIKNTSDTKIKSTINTK